VVAEDADADALEDKEAVMLRLHLFPTLMVIIANNMAQLVVPEREDTIYVKV
jgi:hypothetical protein